MTALKLTHVLAFLGTTAITTLAAAEPPKSDPDAVTHPQEKTTSLTLFTAAGYLATNGPGGGALSAGVRLAIGSYFALGFDLGYGLLATQTAMEDRWWFIPSMAVVIPARFGRVHATFDIGAGLGLGTASGYGSASEYTSHPLTATWEFQLEPAVRAHAIAAFTVSRSLDVFARADAAALVLPHGSNAGPSDSTWLLFSLGARFRVL